MDARLKPLNEKSERPGKYVLYWMQQSQRADCNHALEAAIARANQLGLPVLACFGLTADYPEANARHYTFMLEGLTDVRDTLLARGVGFVMRRGAPDRVALELAQEATAVFCDRGYLRHQKAWRRNVADNASCTVVQVETDVVVPIDLVSSKVEIAARTLRPKLAKLRDSFMVSPRGAKVAVKMEPGPSELSVDISDIPALLEELGVDDSVPAVRRFKGGSVEAQRRLQAFISGCLPDYADASNDDRRAYLDELIVRRELAMNFVEHQPDYDSFSCIPKWAAETLRDHRNDRRLHVYSETQLAAAQTHDPYWNAAMKELRSTGYMHNHMRMYWGKKILEWSPSPEQAYITTLALNNRYFLCGRDANSYANVAWCFGLHDRPWPERPVFGKVRSMTASGLERKVDIAAYVQRVEELCTAEAVG